VVVSLRDVTEKRAAIQKAEFQSSLLDAAGQAMVATDAAGTILYWNHTAERMYGWSAAESIGRNLRDELPPIELEGHAGHILAELSAGRTWSGDLVVRRRDGTSFSAFVTDTPVFDQHGGLSGMIAVSTDITDRKQAEIAMRRLSAIVESTGDAIISNTGDGTITSWNRGAETLYGYRAGEAIGRNLTMIAPDDVQDQLFDVLRRVGLGETLSRFETTRRRKDGRLVDVSLTVSPVLGDDGSVVGCSAIARDITARAEAERALNHQAAHDTLTGLPNRVLLENRLIQALGRARRHDEQVAVLFLDLDGFKVVNDGLGHLAGDELLVEVARRLVAQLRPDDTVARFGGDEFAIVCEVATIAVAMQLASRLLECLRPAFSVQGNEVFITGSVGLVLAEHDAQPDALLRDADAAMYRAKERGRCRVEVFDDNLRERAASKLHSATALRRALERGELRVFFQPVVAVDTGQPLAVEALLRWQHPERGLVEPHDIIPVAEDTGMIVPIGRWVLQEALRQRAGWEAVLPGLEPVRLSVNLSARQLSEAGLVPDIKAALGAYGTDPSSIILEITESVLMSDPDSLSTVKAIHDLGISLHVDDFGTGYSSLAYLKTLPVDALKIDRVFVDGLGTDGDDHAIVTAVIALARAMSLGVIAEGVETEAQLRVLRDLGCDHAQGYLFARPMPFDDLVAWFRTDASRTRGRSRASARLGSMRRSPIAGGVA
jgi:diguanylate cyclase (GGDEF)-like protein/PAS domain S-box-containing protein